MSMINGGRPGVLLIMRGGAGADPLKVVAGETLNRAPTVAGDFVAAVVFDGANTYVLDQNALQALNGSAQTWKNQAVDGIHQGEPKAFDEWERMHSSLVPR